MTEATRESLQIVDWHMTDKTIYFPLVTYTQATIRSVLYPVTLIRTRLQVQKHAALYNGFFDALRKIWKLEGFFGLYKGFLVQSLNIVPGMCYITTFEYVKHALAEHTNLGHDEQVIRMAVAGGVASFVGQTTTVPLDVVSQHLQIIGQKGLAGDKVAQVREIDPLRIPSEAYHKRFGVLTEILKAIYRRDGIKGFYKGYVASLAAYTPSSACWWPSYFLYSKLLASFAPEDVPRLIIHVGGGVMAGISNAFLFTPNDAIRARVQVEGTKIIPTTKQLWKEERWRIFTKGLTPRIIQSSAFSFSVVLGYETVKRLSLLEEHKEGVRW